MSWKDCAQRILDLCMKRNLERGLGPLEQFELDSLILENHELWQTFAESPVGQQIIDEWKKKQIKSRDAIGKLLMDDMEKNRGRILYHQAMVDILQRNINMVDNMTAQYRVLSNEENKPNNPKEKVNSNV